MPTPNAVENQIARFLAAGYPHAPSAHTVELTVGVWLDDLNDLNDAEFDEACRAYRRSTDPADRWWPTPGRLRAVSALGRASAALGTSSDAEVAFCDFCARMSFLGFRPDRDDEARHLDPKDPARNDAMFAALAAVGGSRAWGLAPNAAANPIDFGVRQRAWTARYVEVRRGQAADPAIVRSLTTQPTGLVPRG